MRLFVGLERTDYQDLFRALGRQLDSQGVRDLRLVERDGGLTLQARDAADPARGFQTWFLSDEELLALLQAAYQLRGTGCQPAGTRTVADVSYQDLLRAIGRVLDAEGWRDVRLVEQPQGLVVQVTRAGRLLRGFHTYRLPAERVEALVEATSARRGVSEFGDPIKVPS